MLTCKYKNVDNLNIEELELKILLRSSFKMIFIDINFLKNESNLFKKMLSHMNRIVECHVCRC